MVIKTKLAIFVVFFSFPSSGKANSEYDHVIAHTDMF
jgi:hypothetical protein